MKNENGEGKMEKRSRQGRPKGFSENDCGVLLVSTSHLSLLHNTINTRLEFSIYTFISQYSIQYLFYTAFYTVSRQNSTQYSIGAWKTINKSHIVIQNTITTLSTSRTSKQTPRLPVSPGLRHGSHPVSADSQCRVERRRRSKRHILSYLRYI